MTVRRLIAGIAVTATTLLIAGCGDDDTDSDNRWTAEDVQADIARGVATDLGVDVEQVQVACPDGLDPAASEAVEMECAANVGADRYTVEVVADDTDSDRVAFRWRLLTSDSEGS